MPVGKAKAAAPDSSRGRLSVHRAVLHRDRSRPDHRPPEARSVLLARPDRPERRAGGHDGRTVRLSPAGDARTPPSFGQRPKLNNYGNYAFLVFYGAGEAHAGDAPSCARCTCSSRPVPDHDPPRARCRSSTSSARSSTGQRAAQRAVPDLPRARRAHRQLLPGAVGDRRRGRQARGRVLAKPDRRAASAAVRAQAPARGDAQGGHPAARPVRPLGRPARRAARAAARRARLLPRHLRPSDPDQRPDRLLPRPDVAAPPTCTCRRSPTGRTT